MSIPNLTDRNVSPKTTMYSNEPIPSNPLAIAAERAKDICDRLNLFLIEQSGWVESPDTKDAVFTRTKTIEIVKTLKAIEGQNYWSSAVNHAQQDNNQIYLVYANSNLLRCVKVCQPQVDKFGSIETFLDYAETLISVDENTRKAQ